MNHNHVPVQAELLGFDPEDLFTIEPQMAPVTATEGARSLLDQLLTDSKLYTQSKDFKELLDFVVRLRNFAPFNALLLQVQKPGLGHAASAADWRIRFERTIKEGARPLLILWPFGPVALVYDVLDTEGKDLPQDVASCFYAQGPMDEGRLEAFRSVLSRKGIECCPVDTGDLKAGLIRVLNRIANDEELISYRILLNRNHSPAVQFATLAHELGHLFLGHLGPDKRLGIHRHQNLTNKMEELEAESVSFLVCKRNGVTTKSEAYLVDFVSANTTIDRLDIYHSSRIARDRDRIREDVLRSRGWKLHRIWSTDWFQDRTAAIGKLAAALKASHG